MEALCRDCLTLTDHNPGPRCSRGARNAGDRAWYARAEIEALKERTKKRA